MERLLRLKEYLGRNMSNDAASVSCSHLGSLQEDKPPSSKEQEAGSHVNGHVLAVVKVDLPMQLADDPQHLNVPTPTHHLQYMYMHNKHTHTHVTNQICSIQLHRQSSPSNNTHMELCSLLFVVILNK